MKARKSADAERGAALCVSGLMAASARTAPKTRGIDNIETMIINDESCKNRLVRRMKEISAAEKRPSFERDANSIEGSPAIVVIGARSNPAGLNCGFCGYRTCDELKRTKGICACNSIDLGIAVSSAASIAAQFHIDNRVMYSVGRVCVEMGLFTKAVKRALGIPLSISGKSPFFDRK